MHNPSLREESRRQRATIIPAQDSLSILDWLRQQGRLIEQAPDPNVEPPEGNIEDIDDLIGDDGYNDDFDGDIE